MMDKSNGKNKRRAGRAGYLSFYQGKRCRHCRRGLVEHALYRNLCPEARATVDRLQKSGLRGAVLRRRFVEVVMAA